MDTLDTAIAGNLLAVTIEEVLDTAIIAAIVLVVVVLLYKELLGLPVNLFNFGLMLLIALTIVASMKAVGVILVLSLLITPGATAYLLVKRLHEVMSLGALIGIISSISGMYISYFYNLPSGSAIVLVVSELFVLALLFSPSHGIFTNKQAKSGQLSSVMRELKALMRSRSTP